ncbi:hypothetical protein HNP60_001964 [Sphingobium sp. B1D3A]|uniref:HNH endonuclease n=1 Tax=Sphingobium lignivorans TaxID=2735886 RepID=A0ABR6NFD8_9SPHN|nr:hypothetical protein [Sphingobium lignivorans]
MGRLHDLECDICGARRGISTSSLRELEASARADGWIVRPGIVRCPIHSAPWKPRDATAGGRPRAIHGAKTHDRTHCHMAIGSAFPRPIETAVRRHASGVRAILVTADPAKVTCRLCLLRATSDED